MKDGIEVTLLNYYEYEEFTKFESAYCNQTDLVPVTGGFIGFKGPDYHKIDGYSNLTLVPNDSLIKDGLVKIYDNGKCRYENIIASRKDFAIRPVLHLSPERFEELTKDRYEYSSHFDKVKLGEYPQTFVGVFKKYLDKDFKRGDLLETSEYFSINASAHEDHLVDYPVYFFDNRKFVRVRVVTNPVQAYIHLMFYDGATYKSGDYIWLEVEPVEWLVDDEHHMLICDKTLFAGIPYGLEGPFNISNIHSFLNSNFLRDLFQNNKAVYAGKTREIEPLITEIVKYSMYNLGKDNIQSQVDALLKQYNEDVQSYIQDKKSTDLKVEFSNPNKSYGELNDKLNAILEKLKADYEKSKPYYEMKKILNGKTFNPVVEFVNSIKKLLDIELLKDEKENYLNELDSIISKNMSKVEAGLEDLKNGSSPKTVDEMVHEFRSDLQPFIEKLNEYVKKKDIVTEIMKGVKAIVENTYVETHSDIAKNLLKVIKEVSRVVNARGNQEDKDKLKSLLDFHIDYSKNITEIQKELNEIIKELFKIKLEIDERKEETRVRNETMIDIDLDSLFKQEEMKRELIGGNK